MNKTPSHESIIRIIVKSITFIFLIPITFLLLLLHATIGTVIYLWLVLRFLIVYTFSVIKSAYLNKDVSNEYLSLIESLIYNYLRLYRYIFRIPLAVWRTPENIKFEIETILSREKTLLMKNLWLNVLILFLIIASLTMWIFGFYDKIFSLFHSNDPFR